MRAAVVVAAFVLCGLVAGGESRPEVTLGSFTAVVDDGGLDCTTPTPNDPSTYTTIHDALVVGSNASIFVCAGNYIEPTLAMGLNSVSISGPGSTPANDGVATVKLDASSTTVFDISGQTNVLNGLDIDASKAFTDTTAINASADSFQLLNGTIEGAKVAVEASGADLLIKSNKITVGTSGVICNCNSSDIKDNTIESATGDVVGGILIIGTENEVAGNTLKQTRMSSTGITIAITENTFAGDGGAHTLLLMSGDGTVTGNEFSDTEGPALVLDDYPHTTNDPLVTKNTFTDLGTAIEVRDDLPTDSHHVTPSIGDGVAVDANVFVHSGGALGDDKYLLKLNDARDSFLATPNKWGLCSLAEIEMEVYHHTDDPTLGTVDFDPFIRPASCPTGSVTPGPTASPTFVPGDTDCDDDADESDAMNIVAFAAGVAGETACWNRANADCDGTAIDLRDALAILKGRTGLDVSCS